MFSIFIFALVASLIFEAKCAEALFLESTFQDDSLPNHHCIVTGICPDKYGTPTDTYNTEVPIWTQNENAGPGRYSGVFMWPGVRNTYKDHSPTYHIFRLNADEINTSENVIDEFLPWIMDKEKPANLVMAHFDIRATDGHVYRTNINEYNNYIRTLNELFGVILDKLDKIMSGFALNLIVLSTNRLSLQTLPIFMAWGPAFKENFQMSTNVSINEVYPLLRYLLDIDPNTSDLQHNRQMNVMKQLLKIDSVFNDVKP